MTISSSMNAGVAGLRANANRLATISDNIANSATYGYRRAQTSFHSMVTGSGAAGQASYSAGGVRTASQRIVDQGGALIGTQNATDIALSGRGFIPVTSGMASNRTDGTTPLMLSTTGSFRMDADGYMRDPSGNILLGWQADNDGNIPTYPRDSTAGLQPVRIDESQGNYAQTRAIQMGVALPASGTLPDASGDPLQMSVEYFDTLGLRGSIDVEFEPDLDPDDPTNTWQMTLTDRASGDPLGTFTLVFDTSSERAGTLLSVDPALDYDPDTGAITLDLDEQTIEMSIGRIGEGGGIVQRGEEFSPAGVSQDGFGAGNLIGLEIDSSGDLNAIYDTGFRRTMYRIPIVDVPNPNGLSALDNQAYQVSRDSGPFFLWDAGSGPVGEFVGYALEESATDVAAELTSLIQTQRAYSSNAKVIQTVDEMLQETTNIKR
ncbi:MAG: flagellar hook-basal body complex protein [Rhodobacteraceae bacterium]|nr:MAG: flagellar hook-basal body complex protein [Paracoccaceae bacterium]